MVKMINSNVQGKSRIQLFVDDFSLDLSSGMDAGAKSTNIHFQSDFVDTKPDSSSIPDIAG